MVDGNINKAILYRKISVDSFTASSLDCAFGRFWVAEVMSFVGILGFHHPEPLLAVDEILLLQWMPRLDQFL